MNVFNKNVSFFVEIIKKGLTSVPFFVKFNKWLFRRCSPAVQSTRFIPGVSLVQIQPPPPNPARWRSGLTHQPFTLAFMGSNPIRVTKYKQIRISLVSVTRKIRICSISAIIYINSSKKIFIYQIVAVCSFLGD